MQNPRVNDEYKNKVFCHKCTREITSRGSLIITTEIFKPVAYHSRCFTDEIRGFRGLFIDNYPLNTLWGNLGALLAIILVLPALFINAPEKMYIIAALLIFPVYRFIAWYIYELPIIRRNKEENDD